MYHFNKTVCLFFNGTYAWILVKLINKKSTHSKIEDMTKIVKFLK